MSEELSLPGAEVELWLTTSGGASMGTALLGGRVHCEIIYRS